MNRVGRMNDTVGGFGQVPSGDYVVADLSGRVFLDRQRRHRVNLRVENLFDENYWARVTSTGVDPAYGRNYYGAFRGMWRVPPPGDVYRNEHRYALLDTKELRTWRTAQDNEPIELT